LPDGARGLMLAAMNRLLAMRLKRWHALRSPRHPLGVVGKEAI
jgi:hypothetical protein